MASIIALFKTDPPHDTKDRKVLVSDTVVEFFTTTLFVYFGTLAVLATGSQLVTEAGEINTQSVGKIMPIATAFGMAIATLVYATGHLTGGHMNPGVSLLMYLRRQISLPKMICYWLAQFVGALLGSAIVWGSVSAANTDVVGRPPLDIGATVVGTYFGRQKSKIVTIIN